MAWKWLTSQGWGKEPLARVQQGGRGLVIKRTMPSILLLHLEDVFHEACAVFEQDSGGAPPRDIQVLLAGRISELATTGVHDPDRLRAFALQGLLTDQYSVDRRRHLN
jgi:hypothetical protein